MREERRLQRVLEGYDQQQQVGQHAHLQDAVVRLLATILAMHHLGEVSDGLPGCHQCLDLCTHVIFNFLLNIRSSVIKTGQQTMILLLDLVDSIWINHRLMHLTCTTTKIDS